VTPEDVQRVARVLVEKALAGDVAAAKVLLERCLGPPVPLDLLERLAALEEHLGWE
jgi:hypothetical protein